MSAAEIGAQGAGEPRPRVMVVDDEPHIRSLLRRVLSSEHYDVLEASDGQEALELYRQHGADLILSDLLMPRMNGLELLENAKRSDDTLGFVLLTGAGTMSDAVQALRQQADDYLLKPFNLDEVTYSVARALRHRQLVRENRAYQHRLEERVDQQATELENLFVDALLSLANAIEARDGYTGGHVERVTGYAMATGKALGLPDDALKNLWVSGLLHDVGKIGVPDRILTKPGKLTDEEYRIMQRHPEIGAAIMQRSSFLRPAVPGVLHHQERWDGTGYPAGLRAEQICVHGRILAVADTFDAIISTRPYRVQRSVDEAVAELRRCSGTQFDPSVVEAFVRAMEKGFPEGASFPPVRYSVRPALFRNGDSVATDVSAV
jgi:response regulator RpfG family c-di-GMP phosphodiesterase